MSRFSRITYLILLVIVLLIIPAVHAQDTPSDQILYTVIGENGDYTIYSVNVDSGAKTQIDVIPHLYDAGWSPDGQFIYLLDYEAEFGVKLTLLDVDTNRRQTLPDALKDIICWLPISWSPDSQWLAYTSAPNPNPLHKIYNVSTGKTQVLPDADTDNDFDFWSPDSRYIAYQISSEAQTYKMAVWDVKNQRTALVINLKDLQFPKWSPTESRIAFQEVDSNSVIIYNFGDGTKQEYENSHIGSWSPDGRFLTIYHTDAPIFQIIDVLNQKPVEFGSKTDTVSQHIWFNWSPDSRYLVTSLPDKNHPDNDTFQILDVLKGSIQSTKISVHDYNYLIWSPWGNAFVLASNAEFFNDGEFLTSFWLHDLDQGQSNQYPAKIPPYNYNPQQIFDWSATGLYMIVDGDLFDWASRQINPIKVDGQSMHQPRWSPDGTKLALSSVDWNTGDLYVLTLKGNTAINLTNTPDEVETFLGWRGTQYNDSLIGPCGET